MSARLIRNAINSIVPNWLSNRPGLNTGFKVLYSIALVADLIIENGWRGFQAALPGVGTETALPLLGQSRGLVQGAYETNANFIGRLQNWLASGEALGSSEGLVETLQPFLTDPTGNTYPIVDVDRNSQWTVDASPPPFVIKNSNWNWDEALDPGAANGIYNIWVILFPSAADTQWASTKTWGQAGLKWGDGTAWGFDGPTVMPTVKRLIRDTSGAHNFCLWIIVVLSPNSGGLFTYSEPADGVHNPNGTFGRWTQIVNGQYVLSRFAGARYANGLDWPGST